MVVALEGVEGQAARQGAGQGGQLMAHQLVGKGVGLSGHANGQVVALGEKDLGQQVGDGLANAGTGLDGAVRRGVQGPGDLGGHGNLLGATLDVLVHPAHRARLAKLGLYLGRVDREQSLSLERGVVFRLGSLGAEKLISRLLKMEVLAGVPQRQLREDRAKGPVDLRVHVGEKSHEARRHIGQRAQDDAPHAAQRVHVVAGTMRDRGTAKGLGHRLQAVRRQPGQRDSRQSQGIDPDVAHVVAAGHRLDKGAVEGRVVRQHGRAAHKVDQRGHGLLGVGRVHHVEVCDRGQLGDLGRDGPARVHEGLKTVDDLASTQAGGRDLDQGAVLERQAGRLGVQDHHVVLKQAKVLLSGSFGQREVLLGHSSGSTGQHKVLEEGAAHLVVRNLFNCHRINAFVRKPQSQAQQSECRAQRILIPRGARSRAEGCFRSCRGSCLSPKSRVRHPR